MKKIHSNELINFDMSLRKVVLNVSFKHASNYKYYYHYFFKECFKYGTKSTLLSFKGLNKKKIQYLLRN